jgi:hypothetical protein
MLRRLGIIDHNSRDSEDGGGTFCGNTVPRGG